MVSEYGDSSCFASSALLLRVAISESLSWPPPSAGYTCFSTVAIRLEVGEEGQVCQANAQVCYSGIQTLKRL